MANIKLSKLIKKLNKAHKPPGGWQASDAVKCHTLGGKQATNNEELKLSSEQADKREGGPTSEQAHNLHANNSARFVESAQAYEGRKPKSER